MSSRADATAALVAKQVQEHAPTWFVMWSPWRRRFDAWECSAPDRCRTVHGRTATELWNRMRQVDLDLRRTLLRDAAPPAPGEAGHPGPPDPVAPGHVPGPRGRLPSRQEHVPGPPSPTEAPSAEERT
ncbi:hypothetical protein FHS43_000110 [Streptosporangium becharense]|uniref:Uncharacterized protein n=1 Tax=Streptosporangium becharense TaxID=1816182 RepID=A0A7W9IHA3_9ACTN|nr:hypothetical protein [Streptosporangium becharense]MBB2908864.1 hypothetical protein [Streptosporangium becharense]MBB5820118.1 hypothetical protein [Streptosporangium becharense]